MIAAGDPDGGRSISTDPRHRRPLTAARRVRLEACEHEMTGKLVAVLDREAESAAIVSRVGSDLSQWRFEGEPPRFTHTAIAVRDGRGWWMDNLLNTGEGTECHLYRQPPLHFFRDDPFEYRAAILVPSRRLQLRLAAFLRSPARDVLYTGRYSRIAYPFSTRYQSCNQWVIEVIAAAQSGGTSRREAQAHLQAAGYAPDVLRTVGLVGQTLAPYRFRNTRFDDHPLSERVRGRIACVLEPSLRRYLLASDAVVATTVIGLGVAPGAPCPPDRLPGSQDA